MADKSTLDDITLELKEQNKTEDNQTVILRQIAASLAGPSASQLAEEEQKRKPKVEGGGGGMGGGPLKGIMGIFKSIGGFIKKLKAGLLFLLLPAVLLFINSPFFKKAISFIKDTLMPALKSIWEWLKLLFADPKAALLKLWNELTKKAADIGSWIWDNAIVPAYEWLKGIFVNTDWKVFFKGLWDKLTGSAKHIGQWIWKRAINPFWLWIKGIVQKEGGWGPFFWGLIKKYLGMWKNIGEWIYNKAIKPIWEWIKGIVVKEGGWGAFFWNLIKEYLGLWKTVGEWIWNKAVKPFWDWIKGVFVSIDWKAAFKKLFGFAKTIGTWLWNKAVKPFWRWIKGVFVSIDWKQAFKSLFGLAASIGSWIWNKAIKPFWNWIKGVFSPEGGWKKFFQDAWEKLTAKAKDVGSWIWDHTIGPIWDWIKGIFTFKKEEKRTHPDHPEEEKGVMSFLKTHLLTPVWEWFKDIFDFSSVRAGLITAAKLIFLPHWFLIDKVIKPIWKWFKGLLGWDKEDEDEANKDEGITGIKLFDFVLSLPGKVWAWLKKTVLGWFGLTPQTESADMTVELTGDAKTWSLSNLVGGVIGKLMGFFNNMMDFDLGEMTKKLPGYDTFKEVTGWFDSSNLPNTGVPGRDNPYVAKVTHAGRHPLMAVRNQKIRADMPESRKERMAELQSSIYRQQLKIDKSIAGTLPKGRVPFKRDQAIAAVQKMQGELDQLQALQMKFDDNARKMATVLLSTYNAGPPSQSSTVINIDGSSSANTTAVTNLTDNVAGASDPYVVIGRGR